jgi:hypothetical protein
MYLTNSHRGYTRDGQQRASGQFLIVFSHNKYTWSEQTGKPWSEFPADMERVLYAYVCKVTMKQLGHFMMGDAIGLEVQHSEYDKANGRTWRYLVLSGTYGSDGLPCDYEKLTSQARTKLVRVPDDLTEVFWKGGGHNSAGSEAYQMRDWAIKTFKVLKERK